MTAKERDDMLVDIDDFLKNGFTKRVIETINAYFDKLIAKMVKWFFVLSITTGIVVTIGVIAKPYLTKLFGG